MLGGKLDNEDVDSILLMLCDSLEMSRDHYIALKAILTLVVSDSSEEILKSAEFLGIDFPVFTLIGRNKIHPRDISFLDWEKIGMGRGASSLV